MGKRGRKPGSFQNHERNAEIAQRIANGETLKAVGESYGLTRERVRQIANRFGVTDRAYNVEADKRFKILSKLAEEGLSREEMAKRSGYSYGIVCASINSLGVVMPDVVLKKDTHGHIWCYRNGCRCELCRAANNQFAKDNQEKRKNRPENIPHGTPSGYGNHKCRCDACKLAGSIYNKKQRERLKGKTPPNHGHSGYLNYGCRCDECKKGYQEYKEVQRAKKQAAQLEAS